MKACRQCLTVKPLAEFSRHAQSADGLRYKCKDCTQEDWRKYRAANAERLNEYHRALGQEPERKAERKAWGQTPAGKEIRRRAERIYRDRNPVKHAAHIAVNNAIQGGQLARKPCEVCGDATTHGHHDDYSKPLDVRWLCRTHHVEWHRHNKPKCPPQEITK